MSSVLQKWMENIPWRQQSTVFSALRGPDGHVVPNVKILSRWLRQVTQENADPTSGYMTRRDMPPWAVLKEELEHLPLHYVNHLNQAMRNIGEHHPEEFVRKYAMSVYVFIVEKILHLVPEYDEVWRLRNSDKTEHQ